MLFLLVNEMEDKVSQEYWVIGIPLVARQTYDNVFGLSIMIFTASSKITSLPKDINRLHLAASSALNFAYMTSKGTTGSNISI